MDMHTVGRFKCLGRSRAKALPERQKGKLRKEQIRLLMHTVKHASGLAALPFFDKLLVQMLDALHGGHIRRVHGFKEHERSAMHTAAAFAIEKHERTAMHAAAALGLEGVIGWIATCPGLPGRLLPYEIAVHAIRAGQMGILLIVSNK